MKWLRLLIYFARATVAFSLTMLLHRSYGWQGVVFSVSCLVTLYLVGWSEQQALRDRSLE